MSDDICPICKKEKCPMCKGESYHECWTYLTGKNLEDPDCYFLESNLCRLDKDPCPYSKYRTFDDCPKLDK